MTAPWTFRLAREHAGSLSRLFHVPGLRVCEVADHVWVRGELVAESVDQTLRGMAAGDFFWIESDGEQLRKRDARVPSAELPRAEWQPLARFLQPERPVSVWPGELSSTAPRLPLRLVLADDVTEPNLLLTNQSRWAEYAVTAAQVRLDRWRFALAQDGRALIRGEPLPSLMGDRFVEREGIAVLAGWTWSPLVDAAVVRKVFGLGANDIVMWSREVCEVVRGEQFVTATRSGVRELKEKTVSGRTPKAESRQP